MPKSASRIVLASQPGNTWRSHSACGPSTNGGAWDGRPCYCMGRLWIGAPGGRATRLAAAHLVGAVNRPRRVESPKRTSYELAALVGELAECLQYGDARRAPIVIGKAESALPASMFSVAFASHAVVPVEQRLDLREWLANEPLAANEEQLATAPAQWACPAITDRRRGASPHAAGGDGTWPIPRRLPAGSAP